MRRITIVVATALCAALLAACGGDDDDSNDKADKAKTYFGWLLGTGDPVAVAIEVDRPDSSGMSKVRAYVCDGRSEPEGMAVWFSAPVDTEATTRPGANSKLTSVGGDEELVLEYVADGRIQGSFKGESGKRSQFAAYPAIDGAGIYEVTLNRDLEYTGTSIDGNKLEAKADRGGRTSGTITTADDEKVEFSVQSLSLATPAQLTARGLPSDYGKYKRVNQVPGEYTAVIAPGGSHWLGRGGSVRAGTGSVNIIGLDKKC